MTWSLHRGDCLDMLRAMPAESVDAVVCDPPYGLGFMGKAWDALPPGVEWAEACLRVLKPGGHLVAFGGTRTVHRLTCAVEDAGFEVRDSIGWVYFSGFPKSLDVSKALDKAAGAEREVVGTTARNVGPAGTRRVAGLAGSSTFRENPDNPGNLLTAPATPDAVRWSGWGTAVKPAIEPAILARKPLDGTVAANVIRWATGALNIDGCRFAYGDPAWVGPQDKSDTSRAPSLVATTPAGFGVGLAMGGRGHDSGRFPANLYYCPKASRSERERGCDDLPSVTGAEAVDRVEGSAGTQNPRAGAGRTAKQVRNAHPTVKPVRLMRWLCRLVTPPGGLVVDPFAGSGTTGIAALLEGFQFVGAEMTPEYADIAEARIAHAATHPERWATTAPGFGAKGGEVVEIVEEPSMPQLVMFGGAR